MTDEQAACAPQMPVHASDCALHDGPAYTPGPCSCGADPTMTPERYGSESPSGDEPHLPPNDKLKAVYREGKAMTAPQMPGEVAALVERLEAGLEGVTPGPWDVWAEPTPTKADAIRELTNQVTQTDLFGGVTYLLNAGGKCPATTGCSVNSAANARHIANCDPDTIRTLISALQAQAAEIVRLQDRLEMRSAYKLDADGSTLVKVDVETGSIPDGIDCRDETIKGLDKLLAIRSAALAEAVDRAEAAERVRDDLFEQIAELRKSADWHKSQECMALQNEIVHRAEAAEAKLREAVEVVKAADEALNYVGDVLNNMDAVLEEDVENTTGAFDSIRAFLSSMESSNDAG